MAELAATEIAHKIGKFVKSIFIEGVHGDAIGLGYTVKVDSPDWLMNDHFPGTSIIQCFFQGAMLLYYANNPGLDPEKDLFFLGDLKVKYRKPIFLGETVTFTLKTAAYMANILLYEGECFLSNGSKCTTLSGSISTKPRSIIPHKPHSKEATHA